MERSRNSYKFLSLSFLGPTSQPLVLTHLQQRQARNHAASTLANVVLGLKRFIRLISENRRALLADDLRQTTARDVDDFLQQAQHHGLAPSTVSGTLSVLKDFFAFLIEEGQMLSQPVKRHQHQVVIPDTLPKPMAEPDVVAFFNVIDSVRDRLIFLLMLRCGLRVSETCTLAWEQIDWPAGTIRIDNSKGQVDRIVYVAPDVEQALQKWQPSRSRSGYLFPSPYKNRKGAPLTPRLVQYLMAGYLQQAGVTRPYSPHCLRHTFATQLLNAGMPLEVLKELMGHDSLQMTLRYAQLYESTKRQQYTQAMQRIEQRQAMVRR